MKKLLIVCCALLVLSLTLVACDSKEEIENPPEAATEIPAAPSKTASPKPAQTTQPTDTPAPTTEPPGETAHQKAEEPSTEIILKEVNNELMGIIGLVPEGWIEAAPGVYQRGGSTTDVVSLIQQAAGMEVEALSAVLLQQLGIDSLPEPTLSYQSGDLLWNIYFVEVDAPPIGSVSIDIALAESGDGAYIVLLQSGSEEYDSLHENVFTPAVEAFRLVDDSQEDNALFEDPDGRYTVPIPTNWQAVENQGFATLTPPDENIKVHIIVLEDDDPTSAVEDAWEIIDPDFAKPVSNQTEVPPSVVGGVDEYVVVDYEFDDDDELIVQAEARLFQDHVYILIYEMTLEAAQQRSSQIQIISSGFTISDLETKDLSGIVPLPFEGDIAAEFETFVNDTMDEFDVPGASIAVIQDGELVYAKGFGVKDRDSEDPVEPDTMMMIGSTTKSMTTMLMAELVDEGVFEWDTRVIDVLPAFSVSDPEVTDHITMRNLVCACTGVPRRDLEWLFNSENMTAENIIESLSDFEFFTDFGEAFQYSNQMVAAGGYISALAAGGEYGSLYEDYISMLAERVLIPIGMGDSTFSFDEIEAEGRYAAPYGKNLEGDTIEIPLSYEKSLVPLAPAGALWSNVIDMSRYMITLLQDGVSPSGQRLVSGENLAVTWEPQVEISADADYGLGWIIEDYDGLEIISHAGNTFGYSSEFAFAPQADLGVVILTNQRASAFNPFVRSWLFERLYQNEPETEELMEFVIKQQEEGASSIRRRLVDQIEFEDIEQFLGSYHEKALGSAELRWQDDQLYIDFGLYQNEIRALENDGEIEYSTYSPPTAGLPIKLELDSDENPTMTLGLGLVEYIFTKDV